jgi:hypothetical protein
MRLTGVGLALRTVHVAVAAIELAALGELWLCALTNRRGKALWVAGAVLALEGAGLVVGRGDCPLGPLQERVGDPVPLFELVLSRRGPPRQRYPSSLAPLSWASASSSCDREPAGTSRHGPCPRRDSSTVDQPDAATAHQHAPG